MDGRQLYPVPDAGRDRLLGSCSAPGAGARRGGLDAVGGFERLDSLGGLARRRQLLFCRLGRCAGERRLELIA